MPGEHGATCVIVSTQSRGFLHTHGGLVAKPPLGASEAGARPGSGLASGAAGRTRTAKPGLGPCGARARSKAGARHRRRPGLVRRRAPGECATVRVTGCHESCTSLGRWFSRCEGSMRSRRPPRFGARLGRCGSYTNREAGPWPVRSWCPPRPGARLGHCGSYTNRGAGPRPVRSPCPLEGSGSSPTTAGSRSTTNVQRIRHVIRPPSLYLGIPHHFGVATTMYCLGSDSSTI
jgi:hypothetical protein